MRRHYRGEPTPSGPRMNERIRITPIRLIDENGEMVGVVDTDEARRRAADLGLDLVEMAADVRPPVCRIMDYGKYRFEQRKKDRAGRARSKGSELKEVRLGRSMKIDPHDVGIRMNQARKFLMAGHRVQIVQNFRGAREMAHRDRGDSRMREVIEELADISKVEMPPRLNGRRMNMILVPDRPRIEAIKRQQAADAAAAAPPPDGADAALQTPPPPAPATPVAATASSDETSSTP
ncbi:MAG: translation initiation factor IF-3 [Phycisphaerales bacterium]